MTKRRREIGLYGLYYIRRLRSIVRSKHGGALKAKYFYMTEHGKGKKISITAIARKMAKLMYLIMKNKGEEYKELPAPASRAG